MGCLVDGGICQTGIPIKVVFQFGQSGFPLYSFDFDARRSREK